MIYLRKRNPVIIQFQSELNIMDIQSNIIWFCTQHKIDRSRTYTRFYNSKRHTLPRHNWQAMSSLLYDGRLVSFIWNIVPICPYELHLNGLISLGKFQTGYFLLLMNFMWNSCEIKTKFMRNLYECILNIHNNFIRNSIKVHTKFMKVIASSYELHMILFEVHMKYKCVSNPIHAPFIPYEYHMSFIWSSY